MMDMGIPNEKAELALSETGNVGVEVATEWLFSVPDHVLEKHLASEPNTPVEAAQQNPEDTRVLLPRRVPLQVSCGCRVANPCLTLCVWEAKSHSAMTKLSRASGVANMKRSLNFGCDSGSD